MASNTKFLPPELWLEVFEHLDYETLKTNVSAVCRDFRTLLQPKEGQTSRSKLDFILFRDRPLESHQAPYMELSLHPILRRRFKLASEVNEDPATGRSNLRHVIRPLLDTDVCIGNRSSRRLRPTSPVFRDWEAYMDPIAGENATSPAVRHLALTVPNPANALGPNIHKPSVSTICMDGAVSVRDVLDADLEITLLDAHRRLDASRTVMQILLRKDPVEGDHPFDHVWRESIKSRRLAMLEGRIAETEKMINVLGLLKDKKKTFQDAAAGVRAQEEGE